MKKLFTYIILLFLGTSLFAADLPKRPMPPTLVTDFANVLSATEKTGLERKLVNFFAATSTQIAVVTVPELVGYDISDYAFRLGEAWGVGDARFNNGILVLVKPRTRSEQGEVFIAVGYGLEGVVPDATAKQIVENEMLPLFRDGNMHAGIDKATTVLISLTKGEYNHQQYAKQVGGGGFNPFLLFFVIFFIFPLIFGRKRRGYYSTGGRSSLPLWLALGMLGGSRRSHGGAFNNFSSGGGSFGGGGNSFGSFGGFGGGSFGGGGAGGRW